MKSVSHRTALGLGLLAALYAAAKLHAANDPQSLDLTGTVWSGMESDGQHCDYYFQPKGELDYGSPLGFWKNGTWSQDGLTIYMETNHKYSEARGFILGSRMKGRAWNVVGQKWTWDVRKR